MLSVCLLYYLDLVLTPPSVVQEYDVIWMSAIPEEDWHYPAVNSVDWPRTGQWPEYLNTGTLMAKPGAVFLKYAMDKLRSDS